MSFAKHTAVVARHSRPKNGVASYDRAIQYSSAFEFHAR
jgi:hypothetical protein